jgi:hypothetical protein
VRLISSISYGVNLLKKGYEKCSSSKVFSILIFSKVYLVELNLRFMDLLKHAQFTIGDLEKPCVSGLFFVICQCCPNFEEDP